MANTQTKTVTKTVKATRATKAKEQKAINELFAVPNVANLLPASVEQPAKPQKAEPVVKNGIKAPMRAGKCMLVWQTCQSIYEQTGKVPTLKEVMAHEALAGANPTNTQIEFYRWRKFEGLNGK